MIFFSFEYFATANEHSALLSGLIQRRMDTGTWTEA